MNERKIYISILTTDNCPACDKLKEIVHELVSNNQFLAEYVTAIRDDFPYDPKKYNEFPVFQIHDNADGSLLYEVVGCYSRATVMWKMLGWIVNNG